VAFPAALEASFLRVPDFQWVTHALSPEWRPQASGKINFPSGKLIFPGGEAMFPGGEKVFPGGKLDSSAGKFIEPWQTDNASLAK